MGIVVCGELVLDGSLVLLVAPSESSELGFDVLFAAVIVLVLVPCASLARDDVKDRISEVLSRLSVPESGTERASER